MNLPGTEQQWHEIPHGADGHGDIVAQWAGGRGHGLSEVTAKIEANKYRKQYPGHNVLVEDAGWYLSNGSPAFKIVVRRYLAPT